MFTLRRGLACAIAALGAGTALYIQSAGDHALRPEANRELVGWVESAGLDPTRLRVRLSEVRLTSGQGEHWADVERDGKFRATGLLDTDYRLEVVARQDPSFVLGQLDFVRPTSEFVFVAADPTLLWGPGQRAFTRETD